MNVLPDQFEDMLSYSDELYMIIDFDWIIHYANQSAEILLGTPVNMFINTDLRDTLPDVVSMFYKTLNATLKHREKNKTTVFYGPSQKRLELHCFPTDYGLLSIFHDITIREQRVNTIYDSETRHRVILETLSDAFVTIDNEGLITSFNKAAEKMFGYQTEEIIGHNVSILLPENERKSHEDYTAYSDLYETRILDQFRELKGLRKDGISFPIELNVSPMHVEGQFGYVGIIRDITRRKIAENKIVEGKAKAEKANKAKSEFLSSMSHELRTPLNAIMGYSQLLKIDPELGDKYKEQIFEIHKAGQHLLDMVEDVLNFTKIDAGNIEIDTEVFSIKEILDECILMLNPLSTENNISLIINPITCNGKVEADRIRVRQVIFNLLSNAIKYNCANGKVIIKCEERDNDLFRMTISDTGPGIDTTRLDDIFEPFNRLGKEGSTIQGTGIGLSIVKQLMLAMNGNTGVESIMGEGSNFWIELPLSSG